MYKAFSGYEIIEKMFLFLVNIQGCRICAFYLNYLY